MPHYINYQKNVTAVQKSYEYSVTVSLLQVYVKSLKTMSLPTNGMFYFTLHLTSPLSLISRCRLI